MDTLITKKNKSLKCGLAIKILSIISLICTVLSCAGKWIFPSPSFPTLISSLLTITPVVLFVLYIFKFYNKAKATILVPIIFGSLIFEAFRGPVGSGTAIIVLLNIVACIFALISSLIGFKKKIFIKIAISLCLLFKVLLLIVSVLSLIRYFKIMDTIYDSWLLSDFSYILGFIGSSALYVALLIFASKNNIPSILSPTNNEVSAEDMSPEQALKLLQCKHDLNIITEEEYQAQRAKIISKL